MTWLKLDDRFPRHPKVLSLSDRAFRAHVSGLCYCAEQLTDGVVEAGIVDKRAARELVGAGLWIEMPAGRHRIHDFLDYNPSKAEAMARADAKRIAGAKGAAVRWHGRENAPTRPVPDPSPNGEAEPPAPIGATVHNRPDHDQTYLAEKIADRWESDPLSPKALQKLNNEFGRPAVTGALRSLHGFPPETLESVYGYVTAVCREQVSA